jgi:sugar (pentulose or hexulose) kinase
VALGALDSIDSAAATVQVAEETRPDPAAVSLYGRQRQSFTELYAELQPAFRRFRAGLAEPRPGS